MIKNYFKTAWRNLLKNKFYSLINIAGLTVGLAIGLLILLWVQDELSFDSFYKKAPNIYRLELFGGTGASRQIWTYDAAAIGALAKQELSDVQNQVRITANSNFTLYKYGEKAFGDETAVFADSSFFSIFDIPLLKGNNAKPFTDDNSVVITQKTAKKFFGDKNPIGNTITADDRAYFTVSGVIPDFPKNSSMQYDMLMPMSNRSNFMLAHGVDMNADFNFYNYETYLQLKPGTNLASLSKQLFNVHIKRKPEDTDADYLLLPISKMHLYNADGTAKGIETVRVFIVIAILILIIACINYVNLSTARSMLRAKEISMRKIVGAGKGQLFMQFITETALLFSLAAILAIGLIFMAMPVFNQLAGKQLTFNLADHHVWLTVLATITGTLAASSIYPALLLSSFEPLKALKGKITAGIGDVMFRKVLVVTQFCFSVILIVGTIVITKQLNYIRSKDLGYDKTHVFSFPMRDLRDHYDAVKAQLMQQPGVVDVTRASQNIVAIGGIVGDNEWGGKLPGQTFIVHPMAIDKDFLSFFKMKLAEGNNFSDAANDSVHYILNETAVKELGMKNPVGKWFRLGRVKGTIIGVVKDFHFASMKEKIAPAIFFYDTRAFNNVYIKTTGNGAQQAISAAGNLFKQYNGQYPFSYAFLDDSFNKLYQGEQREGTLFSYFAAIAIIISCLGLLGLAAFTAQVRNREIGVRKVLGASVGRIVGLLATDFIKLVVIAIVIAIPVAWWVMNSWLQGFAYKTIINWWVFAGAGLIAVVIAFMAISFQSLKAAIANPIKILRSE